MKRPTPKVGDKFGRLEILPGEDRCGTLLKLRVRCSCGTEKYVSKYSLLYGITESCGCIHRESMSNVGKSNRTHGKTRTPAHNTWSLMRQRCNNPNDKDYKNYGARGVTVCSEWLSFDAFYADMGDPPAKGMTLDRIDNSKGYFKENCKWSTPKEQASNRRTTVWLEYGGDRYTWATLADKFGISAQALMKRVKSGHKSTLSIRRIN